jgi:hypothetical protein
MHQEARKLMINSSETNSEPTTIPVLHAAGGPRPAAWISYSNFKQPKFPNSE